jgi:adenylate kinase family enzyme
MKLLEQVASGRSPAARRVMLYGTHGVGKSTFASRAPKPVFIQTEDGLGEIDCDKFPLTTAFEQAMQALSELYTDKHPYRTIVVDSLDWLERLIWAEVCRKRNVESIEDIGYAKGYVFALTQWREFLEGLTALRNDKGMMVVLISHARIERFENPETESYDRYVPRLHRLASQVLQEWCDEVLFATFKVYTKQTDEGFDRKRTQGIGTGERIIRTVERPAHVAKNRLNLPEEMPLDWNVYAKYLTNGHTSSPQGGKSKGAK